LGCFAIAALTAVWTEVVNLLKEIETGLAI
jgi:hypothetical protein